MLKPLAILAAVLAFLLPIALYAYIHWPGGHDGRTHIRYMAWGSPEQQSTDYALLKKFEQQHPHIKVDFILVPGGDYHRKLQVMLASNTEPDVFKMDLYYLPKYFPYGYFEPLDDFDANDPAFSFDDFYPITKNELTYQGKIYGLNTLFGGKIIYYNKDAFRAAGLPDPFEQFQQGQWTLDAFLHAAKTLTTRDQEGNIQQFGLKLDTNDLWWIIWTHGGEIIDKNHNVHIDSPHSIDGLQFYYDLQHKHHVMPRPGEDAGGVFAFETGRLAMASGFAGESPRFRAKVSRFNWDIVPVPVGPAGHHSLLKGNGLIISSRSKHKPEAWELIKFLNSPEGEMAYAGPALRRAIPTRISVTKMPEYLAADGRPPYNNQSFLELHKSAHQLPVTPKWQEWQQEYTKWMDRLHRKVAPPADIARGMAADIRTVLGPPTGPPLHTPPALSTPATATQEAP